ncbi:MAG TPA: S9 family peptidase [Bacteroidales bacterium]|nr:S9 family peptidase [Bacteroidales bacterium]
MKKIRILLTLTVLMASARCIQAQEQAKEIRIEDIWASRIFSAESVSGLRPLKDGKTYATIEKGSINIYDYASSSLVKTMVSADELIAPDSSRIQLSSYELSQDENLLLIPSETEQIYRHSTRSNFYIFDLRTRTLSPLSSGGKQQLATFSPDGQLVAFVRDNNIFVKNLNTNIEQQITADGKPNHIINGTTDWVYEEEFSFTRAFFWAPDSRRIAYLRFDESKVREFNMVYYNDLYPELYTYKYPKAGEDNAIVTVHIWDKESGQTLNVDTGQETDIYIPRIGWTTDPNLLSIQRLNRLQNHLEVFLADATSGRLRKVYDEHNQYYVDITDDLTFLPDGRHFIISSERDGFNHLYLYDLNGRLVRQLTKGSWDVTKLYGYSSRYRKIYFQAAAISPTERQLYSVDLKGKISPLVLSSGHNNAFFSDDFSYFIHSHSTINQPPVFSLRNNTGKELRILKDNSRLRATMKDYGWHDFEFYTIEDPSINLPDGSNVSLNAWMLKPETFDPIKKYPVLIYIYGGPGAQTVNNSWSGGNNWWFQMLADQGFIVVSVDNRGTGSRGEAFKKMTYMQLGKYETEDLIATARYLSGLNFVDPERIGIFGWSYGGYMSSLGITKGADVFRSAIAVAPVTNWRYYDNIYTERYMRKPQENAEGYDQNSPINHVSSIKGHYLLVHGSADDNVHYQNAMEMINALVAANKQFELMIYPNRNHGIFGGNTRVHLYRLMTDFLNRTLKAE